MKKYIYIPKKTNVFTKNNWVQFFRRYINSRKDFVTFWQTVSLKFMDLLIKEHVVKIPYIGTLEVRVKSAKKPRIDPSGNPYFSFPQSEIIFVPDAEFRKIFDKKFFAEYEIKQLQDKTFDWIKKSNDTIKY